MSETVIFVVGVIVFAITVYGTVMAAGSALARADMEQNPSRQQVAGVKDPKKRLPETKN